MHACEQVCLSFSSRGQLYGQSYSMRAHALLCVLGTCFFVASDTLLCINAYDTPFRLARLLLMATYYIALFLLCVVGSLHNHFFCVAVDSLPLTNAACSSPLPLRE